MAELDLLAGSAGVGAHIAFVFMVFEMCMICDGGKIMKEDSSAVLDPSEIQKLLYLVRG